MFNQRKEERQDRRGRRRENRGRMMEAMAAGRGPFSGSQKGGPFGRGFGDGGGGRRRGRFLGQGEIRLLALALIELAPRHGYDLIKEVEEMSQGHYVPSPGIIYPTLTYLEEAGHVVVEAEGNKKCYAITEEGHAYLDEHRAEADEILARLKSFGERASRRAAHHDKQSDEPALPKSVEAAFLNLREAASAELSQTPEKSTRLVQKLLALAEDIKQP